jgi:thiosulfate/3-mercaptopyruvate sulfurtransferase
VVYDGSGLNLSAPRVWWTFRTFGHDRVSVLDGGAGKWRQEQRPIEQGIITLPPGHFTARLDRAAVRDLASVRANIQQRVERLVDTRSAGRFAGLEPEPRPGLRGGHVPGSVNLPFTDLVRPDGTMLGPEELRGRLLDAGIDLSRPVVATCGSGTSACALVLSLHLIGHTQAAVYDGAWAEWGGRADTPIESQLT